jgi:DNA-binding CsgD family transcriptional regulator
MRRDDRVRPDAGLWTGRNEPQGVDPEWLSRTIGAIYDCVLSPQDWRGVIAAVATEFGFHSSVLAAMQLSPGVHQIVVTDGFDDAWLATSGQYGDDSVRIWGGAARIAAFPLDEPIQCTTIQPLSEIAKVPYYREILEPRGLNEAVLVTLARDASTHGYVAFNRHMSASPLGPREMDGLRLLAPHFRRAVTISNLFDLKAVEAATFRALFDGMSSAILLVDELLVVVHANPAAEAMLALGTVIASDRGAIRVAGRTAHGALQSAVQLSANDEAQLGVRGIGIPVQAEGGTPSILHVMPLKRRALPGSLMQRAVAAVFVVPAGSPTPVDGIALLYELTPAETKIFAAISRGRTLDDTAKALCIAKSTARTHLIRIFEKTGCKRQAELVALAARFSLHL